MSDKSDVFYFGCIGQSGHYMHTTHESLVRDVGDMPWGRYGKDGDLPPQKSGQVEGQAMLHHMDGWTALAFWDRSVDTRPGSSSNFFFRGTYDFAETVALARTAFPQVWKRYTFKVLPFKGDDSFQEKVDLILADHAEAEKRREAGEGEIHHVACPHCGTEFEYEEGT